MGQPKISARFVLIFTLSFLIYRILEAHPMPNSVVNLSVYEHEVRGEAKMPFDDFLIAFGKELNPQKLPLSDLKRYFTQHVRIISNGQAFQTQVLAVHISQSKDPIVGSYREITLNFRCIAPAKATTRNFSFAYDVILHQIITHKILVDIVQDWSGGVLQIPQTVGEIALDIPSGKYEALQIHLGDGSWGKGFQAIVLLGMKHISEGHDHMLFLLVLLLPGMSVPRRKHWGPPQSLSVSLIHILRLVTAFTIGHSLTLLIGALHGNSVPQAWVEIWIALSILLSAFHAYRPIFAQNEFVVVAFFGLVHGMAFASLFNEMQLETSQLAWSILGFNLGIECMQILLISLVFPLIFGLSRKAFYPFIRKSGSIISGCMAVYWLWDRIQAL